MGGWEKKISVEREGLFFFCFFFCNFLSENSLFWNFEWRKMEEEEEEEGGDGGVGEEKKGGERERGGVGWVIFYFKTWDSHPQKFYKLCLKEHFSIFMLPIGQNEPLLFFFGQNEPLYCSLANLTFSK